MIKLNKPAETDIYDINVFNENSTIIENSINNSGVEQLTASLKDESNTYYPNQTEELFNTAKNSINGSESIVGSKGFAINEDNFHYGCLGLFVFKILSQEIFDIEQVATFTCERYGGSQDFTVLSTVSSEDSDTHDIYASILTQEVPYIYSEDVYGFSKIIFKNTSGEVIATMQPESGNIDDLTLWYGCVTQWTKNPSTQITDYVELKETGIDGELVSYYLPKTDNIGSFYYVDIPTNIITQNLVNEPTCIKIDANFDSGTRQSYIDWGDDGTLTTAIADQCLKANYTVGDNFLTLTLKKNKRDGQGLEQKPVFGAYSCIRFSDHPEIGNVVVGEGANTVVGGKNKSLFDYGFSSGKNNTSLGRYSVTQGSRNTAVYAGVALGNHNIVLGQSGFAAGATNLIQRGGSNGIALGSENVVSGKNNIAGGRANNVSNLYGVAFGYGNKIKGKSSSALGYTNTLNDDSEFAAGTGNTLSGENAVAIGRANQSYGKSNTCIGYGNIVNKCICGTAIGNVNHVYANYAFAAGNNNTVDADASGVIGLNLNVKISSESGIYDNVGHLLVGSNNTINGGRNLIMGGQSNIALLHDSIVIGNNLKETSKGFGKAIFGNYNAESGASIVLGAGSSASTRKNAFEAYADGAVKTPNARAYKTDGSDNKRLTTKEYVDDAIATAPGGWVTVIDKTWTEDETVNDSTLIDIPTEYQKAMSDLRMIYYIDTPQTGAVYSNKVVDVRLYDGEKIIPFMQTGYILPDEDIKNVDVNFASVTNNNVTLYNSGISDLYSDCYGIFLYKDSNGNTVQPIPTDPNALLNTSKIIGIADGNQETVEYILNTCLPNRSHYYTLNTGTHPTVNYTSNDYYNDQLPECIISQVLTSTDTTNLPVGAFVCVQRRDLQFALNVSISFTSTTSVSYKAVASRQAMIVGESIQVIAGSETMSNIATSFNQTGVNGKLVTSVYAFYSGLKNGYPKKVYIYSNESTSNSVTANKIYAGSRLLLQAKY